MTGFEWDAYNTAHIARHDVTPNEVEELFERDPEFRKSEPVEGEFRFLVYGVTAKGRLLTVACTERNEKVRPITAWDMSRKEINLYAAKILERQEDAEV